MRQFYLGIIKLKENPVPALMKLLSSYDIDLLTRIAHRWGVEDENLNRTSIENSVFTCMTSRTTVDEMLATLPESARKAWNALLAAPGRMPWGELCRKFGEMRELGAAAREREEPDLHPLSDVETLYYRGLIGRGFMDSVPEPQEFAFIPEEIGGLFSRPASLNSNNDIRPVPRSEIKRHQPANLRLLDHMTDWLAAQRMGTMLEDAYFASAEVSPAFVLALAKAANLVMPNGNPSPEKIGQFLQTERMSVIREWCAAWKASAEINDLLMIPDLEFEGTWRNEPVYSRQIILKQLPSFDVQTWYSLPSFISRIKRETPDFLRPVGDFNTWSIRKTGARDYLTGREHWDDVEGAYLVYLFSGPLHWLGIVDLAYASMDTTPIAFRLSPLANFLLDENASTPVLAPETSPKLLTDLTVVMPINCSRLLRYQVGRFTRIISNSINETRFQVTADSLTNAEKNGLKVEQFLQLLEKTLKTPLPPSFKRLAERWDQRHVEVKMERVTLLRVEDPTILKILTENPRTSRLIQETLSEKAILIDSAGLEVIKKVLLEAGILSQIELDV